MPKLTALDRAIASLDADIAVLQAAKQRLVAQQATTKKVSKQRPRAVASMVQDRPA